MLIYFFYLSETIRHTLYAFQLYTLLKVSCSSSRFTLRGFSITLGMVLALWHASLRMESPTAFWALDNGWASYYHIRRFHFLLWFSLPFFITIKSAKETHSQTIPQHFAKHATKLLISRSTERQTLYHMVIYFVFRYLPVITVIEVFLIMYLDLHNNPSSGKSVH